MRYASALSPCAVAKRNWYSSPSAPSALVATSLSQYDLALSHCFWPIASSNSRDRTGTLVGLDAWALRRTASASATGCLRRSSRSASFTARSGESGSSSMSLRFSA